MIIPGNKNSPDSVRAIFIFCFLNAYPSSEITGISSSAILPRVDFYDLKYLETQDFRFLRSFLICLPAIFPVRIFTS